MKILHIQVLPKLAGVQKISLEILKSLPPEIEKYILFADTLDCGDKEKCIEQFSKAGVKVLFSKNLKREINLKDFKVIIEIYRLCKKERFDIVHTNSTKPGIVGRIAASLAQVPLVIHTVHGLSFHKFVKFPKWQFYWACEMFASLFCHKIVLVNKYYAKYFKWFRKKTITIYNGIDFTSMPLLQKQENIASSIRILFVGRLDTQKNPICLLQAAKIVCSRYPNAIFTLVGDGEFYNECQNFITTHNLQNNIKLAGWQTNVTPYYSNNDIFVSSSIYEAFGLTFLEAGYYGLPIVATNVEGIPEVVKDGITGLLCNPNDYITLANNIIKLISNKALQIQLGNSGKERCEQLFSANRMTATYKKLYNI